MSIVALVRSSVWRVSALAGVAVAAMAATPAAASPSLVQNGDFSATTATTVYNGVTVGTETTNSNLTGWQFTGCNSSNCGFSFLANSALATTGWYDAQDGHISTPGTSIGLQSGYTGNAFLSDAAYGTQIMYQAVSGLKVGDTYTLAFSQASFEQSGYSGGFTSNWVAGLGNGAFTAANYGAQTGGTMTVASGGASPWSQQMLTFVANATDETLAFFATASSGANPPFLLLDGVSLTDTSPGAAVPEPATLALAAVGVLGTLAVRRRGRANG